MFKEKLRSDIRAYLAAYGITARHFASASGICFTKLYAFLQSPKKTLTLETLSKIWPLLYGDQTPMPLLNSSFQVPAVIAAGHRTKSRSHQLLSANGQKA